MELFDQSLLFGFVEIDHYVAAEDGVVVLRQVFGFQIVKIELHQAFQRRLDGVLVADFVEIAQAGGVVHILHLIFGVHALLGREQRGIADVRSDDFHLPGRRDQRLGRRHVERERIPQVVIGQRVADHNRQGVRLLAGGAAGAPDAQRPVAALLFSFQDLLEDDFLE